MTVQEFRDRLKGGKYLQFLEECKGRDLTGKRIEKHHIYPKSFKVEGEGTSELIKLSVGDHVLVHIYLFEDLERFGEKDPYYCKALRVINRMLSSQYQSLSDRERDKIKVGVPELEKIWSKSKEVNTRHLHRVGIKKYGSIVGPLHTPEAKRKALESRIEKYGNPAGAMHTPEILQRRKQTYVERYGSMTARMNEPEAHRRGLEKSAKTRELIYGTKMGAALSEDARRRSIETRRKLYGGIATGAMNRPEVKLRAVGNSHKIQTERRNRRKTVRFSKGFMEWFRGFDGEVKRYSQAVTRYLAETNQKLEDFPEYQTNLQV